MSYTLFIDDERFPVKWDDVVIARNSFDAIQFVKNKGIPHHIDFDHDLGGNDTSRIFIKMLINYILDNNLKLPQGFTFAVHSQNPIGAEWIRSTMNGLIEEFGE